MTRRTRIYGQSLLFFAFAPAAIACQTTGKAQRLTDQAAAQVVRHFIVLDSAGKGYLPEANNLFEPCAARASDQLEPVVSATIGPHFRAADTVAFPIEYRIVGFGHSRDEQQVGPRNWTFQFEPTLRTDTVRVLRDSVGVVRIACGPHYGNHPDIAALSWLPGKLDIASSAEWDKALSFARIARH